jgi:anti-anti-sigma regulatory factor
MVEHAEVVSRDDDPDAIVLTVRARNLTEGSAELAALRGALSAAADGGRPVVLDLHAVEFLSSACLGTLIAVRRRLMHAGQPFQPPCRRRALFAVFRDRAAALAAIRGGEPDPLVLCGVNARNQDIFMVC